ncbi:unnamed protein product, partial [Meganyctiphanes norvegica]
MGFVNRPLQEDGITFNIIHLSNGTQYLLADEENPDPVILSSLKPAGKQMWLDCCRAATACCRTMTHQANRTGIGWCPRSWDGWQCWEDSPPSSTAYEHC